MAQGKRWEGSAIVTGIPGAGKTTVAHALATQASPGAHIDIDQIYELIVGGIVFRQDSPAEDWWQLELARQNVRMLARSFSALGVFPVIDDVIGNGDVLRGYLADLPGIIRLIVLAPRTEVVLARDAARHKQVAAQWLHLAKPMAKDLSGLGLRLDTSELDVRKTVDLITERWEEAVIDRSRIWAADPKVDVSAGGEV